MPRTEKKNLEKLPNNDTNDSKNEINEPLKYFGTQVKRHRKERGISQSDLAKRIGVSGSYLSHLESNMLRQPSMDVFLKLCRILDISMVEVLGEEATEVVLSDKERALVGQFRKLSLPKQNAILTIMGCKIAEKELSYLELAQMSGNEGTLVLKEEEAAKPKKKRGRPRKPVDPNAEQKPKRPRGRPKKNPLPEAEGES